MPKPTLESIGQPGQPNLQEVAAILQQRFPREWEIAVLTASNMLLRQGVDTSPEPPHTGDDEEADDVG